jgi:hypothetical protein
MPSNDLHYLAHEGVSLAETLTLALALARLAEHVVHAYVLADRK